MNRMIRRDWMKVLAGAAGGTLLAQTGWQPRVLDAHQNETVIVLTELIIPATDTPGAKAALVNRYIDYLLAEGPDQQRHRFLDGLAFLDGHSIRTHGQPFLRLAPAQQVAMLEAFEKGKGPGAHFFRQVKGITSGIYYATGIGFRELNKGGRVPASFGCKHDGHA